MLGCVNAPIYVSVRHANIFINSNLIEVYICVKLSSKNLNFGPYLPHLTNIYTCKVTITPRKHSGGS